MVDPSFPNAPYAAQTRLLREIAALAGLTLTEKIHRVLARTTDILGLETGLLSRIEGDSYVVVAAYPPAGSSSAGDTLDLGDTYCAITTEEDDVVAIDEMGASPYAGHGCYESVGIETYIGSLVRVGGEAYGTLCFFSKERHPTPFSEADIDLIRFLASWVGTAVERMEADEALRRSEHQLAGVLQAAPDAVVVTDNDRVIEYVNPAFERMFGRAADEVVGQSTVFLYADADEHVRQGTARFHLGGSLDPTPYVVEYRRADGSTFLGETVGGPVGGEGEPTFLLGFVRDVTDREAERTKAEAAAQAEAEAVRSKERFLANMSHEMRTPLNAVLGLSNLLAKTPLSDNQANLLDGVRTAADALLALIDDILNFARLGAGDLPFESIPYSPAEVAEQVERILLPRAREKGLEFQRVLSPSVPELVLGDPTRLQQILTNLAANAIKFTDVGSVALAIDATPTVDGVRLRVEVRDTGIGIPPDRQEAIFAPFTQGADDAARRFGGTGLGLAIVKELVERQQGTITVESEEGRGSTFRVEIPAALPLTDEAPEPNPSEPEPADLSGLRVLVVEDNEMNRLVARHTLQMWGIEVTEARDGREAVEIIEARDPFDLVLMDLQMPEMDGIETTRYIRSDLGLSSDDLPIIALTASVLAYQHADVMAAGLDDFLLKPFDPDVLQERIAVWTARQAPSQGEGTAPALNTEEASNRLGDPALFHEVADLFLREGLRTVQALAAAAGTGDLSRVAAVAHKLKGQAVYVGALALSDALDVIIQSARAGEPSGTIEKVQTALREYRAAANELKRLSTLPHS